MRVVLENPTRIGELLAGLRHFEPGVRMRAADALEKASRVRPEFLHGRAPILLGIAGRTDQPEVQWHLAQMLPRLAFRAGARRRAWRQLHAWLSSRSRIVQACSLEGLALLAANDAALRARTADLVRRALRQGSPAVRARARNVWRAMGRVSLARLRRRPGAAPSDDG